MKAPPGAAAAVERSPILPQSALDGAPKRGMKGFRGHQPGRAIPTSDRFAPGRELGEAQGEIEVYGVWGRAPRSDTLQTEKDVWTGEIPMDLHSSVMSSH